MDEITRLRNVAIVGSHHAGKTTLVEGILAHCRAVPRKGSVADGTATTDYEPECIHHAQSTSVGFAHAQCDDIDLTLIDCPGFIDFLEETKVAISGADSAIVVVDADPSRVPQTQALVEFIESRKVPHLFLVNKMDRPGSDFSGTLEALQRAYGRHVVAEHWPIGAAENFRGYISLPENTAYEYADSQEREIAIPDDLRSTADRARTELLEALGDFDDHLLEELLEGIEPPLAEVEKDLCEDCSHDRIIPVLVAAGQMGAGIAALLKTVTKQFPSPGVTPRTDDQGNELPASTTGPVLAQVIKTYVNPQSGKLSVIRVVSGSMRSDVTLSNASQDGTKARSAGLFRLQGKKQEPLTEASAGQIVAISRLEGVNTGDTLVSNGVKTMLPRPAFSAPTYAVAIKPKERLDEAKLSQTLARILEEDPALRLQRAEFTNELQLLGSGEAHVTTAVERLSRKYNLKLEMNPPAIPYRETITGSTEVHARYKHQTGGHGQFGDVWIRIEPRERGHGVTFEEKIVGGVIPRQFFPAVEKGVREALLHGPAGDYPVVDLHVVLFDGAYHAVDSSEASFKTAASMAIRDGLQKCNPVVLEPIVRVEVTVPNQYTAAAIGQLTSKRGHILGMNPTAQPGVDCIVADVPQVELARYITELRTASQGLGSYTWRHDRFDPVPAKWVAPQPA